MNPIRPPVRAAEVVLPCSELDLTLAFFTERLGFRIETISPADDPSVAVISGHGMRIRLLRGASGSAGRLRLACDDPSAVAGGALEVSAPNGTWIELVRAEPALALPPVQQSFVLSRLQGASWVSGRAGMHYRDLIPGRQGGRFLASHIRIPGGGSVPDYVHFHKVRFQMIYCYRGWGRLVYEDQGPPFVVHAGDCVLQPPEIRHRVLESSPGLEVIEIVCPAGHDTCADHELSLPTACLRPERDFGGQRFMRHEAAGARWHPWRLAGFECRDLGIGAATDGLAGARVVRPAGPRQPQESRHDAEFLFLFLLQGTLTLDYERRRTEQLAGGDALVIPAQHRHALGESSEDLELLEVSLPAELGALGHWAGASR
jgi:quercetin dioxygenase-like cupin family protein